MIIKKSTSDLNIMREGGKILSSVFHQLSEYVQIGKTASQVDDFVRTLILDSGAKPSFLGYQGYKYSTCISKNEEIVHGIPSVDKVFLPGDICSIDAGVYYKGFHVDAARTFVMGPINEDIKKLVEVTHDSFFHGIQELKVGKRLGDLSHAIQSYIEGHGLTVVKGLYSHGIGKSLHEDPLIPHHGKKNKGLCLEPGMTFAIEPMVSLGVSDILTLEDNWTIITADKMWAAHYENTVAILEDRIEVLTI